MDSSPLVLIADDSEVSRSTMANALQAAGFQVMQAIDGGSALKVVRDHPVAVAIIDHFMAPHGGFDFVKRLMIEEIDIPLIMVTSEETSDLLVEINRHKISRYLRKPVDPARLVEAVRRSLREVEKLKAPRGLALKAPSFGETVAITVSPEEAMRKAIDLACKNVATKHGGPFGAVVTDAAGHVIGEGVNGITSRCDPMAHAEVMAIRQATEKLGRTDLEGCILYCTSEPTSIGRALIESVGIGKVYYGLSHEDVSQIRSPRLHPPVIYERLGQDKAQEIFQSWSDMKSGPQD